MYLYIDPGTGSMLFTVLLAVLGSIVFLLRNLKVRFGALLRRDRRAERASAEEELIIFAESKRYWNVFAPICEELEKKGQRAIYLTESKDDPVFKRNFQNIQAEFIGEGNKAFARLNFLSAKVLLATTPSLDVYQWKRSRGVKWYVHIPHAPSDITLYRLFGIDYYDAVLLSGTYQIDQVRQLEALRGLPEKELVLTGLPYMDEMKTRLDMLPAADEEFRTIVLAPSWGESAILSRFGSAIIDALLQTGYHIIIRPHPQSWASETEMIEKLIHMYPDSDQLEWNRESDNFETLSRSDVLISDFSGVIFDYALDKPVIYADTSFDKGPYDCWYLQDELWTFRILPELGAQLTEEKLPQLKELIDDCIGNPKYQTARDKAREETWCHRGEGAKLVADYLAQKIHALKTETDVETNREGDGK